METIPLIRNKLFTNPLLQKCLQVRHFYYSAPLNRKEEDSSNNNSYSPLRTAFRKTADWRNNIIPKNSSPADKVAQAKIKLRNSYKVAGKSSFNEDKRIFENIDRPKHEDPYIVCEKFDAYVNSKNFEKALQIPDIYSTKSQSTALWNKIINLHAKQGNKNQAFKAYNELKKRAFKPNHQTFTTLLYAYSKSKSFMAVGEATDIFETIPKYLGEPSLHHINVMLLICASHDRALTMEKFYQTIPKEGPNAPDIITYTTVLKYHGSKLEHSVHRYVNSVIKNNSIPITRDYKKLNILSVPKKFKSKIKTSTNRKSENFNEKVRLSQNVLVEFSEALNPKDNPETVLPLEESPFQIMDTIIGIWDDYRDDVVKRSSTYQKMHNISNNEDTPALLLDAKIINIFLRAIWSINKVDNSHELVIDCLNRIDEIYCFSSKFNVSKSADLPDVDSERKYIIDCPIVDLVNDDNKKNDMKVVTADTVTVDYYIKLCALRNQYSKGMNFWEYIQDEKVSQVSPSLQGYTAFFIFLARRVDLYQLIRFNKK
ncbi:hypothetical protein BB561_002399 [Smittium simulii]|uniref:Pentacotripeptide-repeat region of PRORP domain-containing protein n=1 Tax=Smittium simulii TaxID=133385 RepID=A0A2T9YQJ0_9FUNG|nr:hypothetical protein BB561_002399 [Smittium simulii]